MKISDRGFFFSPHMWEKCKMKRYSFYKKRKPSTALCCRGFACYVLLSIHVVALPKADGMKVDNALFLKIRQCRFTILLRDKLIILEY